VTGSSHAGGSTAAGLPGKCGTMRVASRPACRASIAGRRSSRLLGGRHYQRSCGPLRAVPADALRASLLAAGATAPRVRPTSAA